MNLFIKQLSKFSLILGLLSCLCACAPNYQYTSGFGKPSQAKQYKEEYKYAGNLWDVLGDNFILPDETSRNEAVQRQIQWYVHNPIYMQRMAQSAAPYLYYIYQQVKKKHLPAELTLLPMVESAYDPFATNYGSGAAGLWQMMPGTASGFGLRVDWWYDGRRDVIASTNAALNYFVFLGKFFNNNWLLAIAAYDSGEGTVQNAIDRNVKAHKPTNFWYLSLPYETESYVPKLLALATIIKNPSEYGIKLPPVRNAPYLADVNVGSQIDLARAAKMAGISLKELSDLNPGFNRWATDPHGSHRLVLPIDNAARFEKALKKVPKDDRVTWRRIKVAPGYNLDSISKKYHTTPMVIRQVNKLSNNIIDVGQTLLIPSTKNSVAQIVYQNEQRFYSAYHNIPLPRITRHVVKKGDTLYIIAKEYHVKASQIRFWNNLATNDLQPGTTLIIWPPHNRRTPYYHKLPTYSHYKVKKGDSLWEIAHKHRATVAEISRINGIKHNIIHPGQTLAIPLHHFAKYLPTGAKSHRRHVTSEHKAAHKTKPKAHHKVEHHAAKPHIVAYRVQAGDDLDKIAQRQRMSVDEIVKLNHLNKKKPLHIGQVLKLVS